MSDRGLLFFCIVLSFAGVLFSRIGISDFQNPFSDSESEEITSEEQDSDVTPELQGSNGSSSNSKVVPYALLRSHNEKSVKPKSQSFKPRIAPVRTPPKGKGAGVAILLIIVITIIVAILYSFYWFFLLAYNFNAVWYVCFLLILFSIVLFMRVRAYSKRNRLGVKI